MKRPNTEVTRQSRECREMGVSDDPRSNATALVDAPHSAEDCQRVLKGLLESWPEEPDDAVSSGLPRHLCECSACRRKWLALELAFELAGVPR